MPAFEFIVLFCAVSFIFYGSSCLLTRHMREEFDRYRLSRFRVLTGVLEIAGAAGLVAGLLEPAIGFVASAGLALLMFLGFMARRRIGDEVLRSFPALLYLILNLYLSAVFLVRIPGS
ncbi:MAG: DoxX family protein [Oceanipulchritudo sp.]|jgi:hypothetical protein